MITRNKRYITNTAYQISFPIGQPLDMLGRYIALRNMKMRTILIGIFFLLKVSVSFSQENNFKNYITLNLLTYMSPYHANIDLSYGRMITSKFHLEVGVAPIIPGGFWTGGDVGREKDNGLILKVEPKYLIYYGIDEEKKMQGGYFISSRVYRTNHNYVSTRFENNDLEDIVNYNVNSSVWGFMPLFGIISQSERYHAEFSAGYGVRKLEISNDYEGNIDDLSILYRLNKRFEPENNGNYIRGSISVNFKIGFRF